MNENCNSGIKHPETVKRLPWWLRLAFTHAEKRLTPKLREELWDVSLFLNMSAADVERLPQSLRRTCETLGAWLDRFLEGEEGREASVCAAEETEKIAAVSGTHSSKASKKKQPQTELPLTPA